MQDPLKDLEIEVQAHQALLRACFDALGSVIVGQQALFERLLIALFVDGHVLLEGVPGLAKTLVVRTLARLARLSFSRIQFTADLLPADVVGTQVYNPKSGEFTVKRGPIFAQIVLADEINRAPAKVQSALLEAMQERQVTLGETSHQLPRPFLVLATQNPIEHEGTYPLPEAQLDRFLMKVKLDYPSRDEELLILDRMTPLDGTPQVEPLLDQAAVSAIRATVDQVYLDAKMRDYIVDLVRAGRRPDTVQLQARPAVQLGPSPRGTIFLACAAKARAFMRGRAYVLPEDVRELAIEVLRHRMILTYEAEAEGWSADRVLKSVLEQVPIP